MVEVVVSLLEVDLYHSHLPHEYLPLFLLLAGLHLLLICHPVPLYIEG